MAEGKSKFILGGPTGLQENNKLLLAWHTLSSLLTKAMFYMIKGGNTEPDFNFHYNSTAFET